MTGKKIASEENRIQDHNRTLGNYRTARTFFELFEIFVPKKCRNESKII